MKFFTRKRIIWGSLLLIVIVLIGYKITHSGSSLDKIQTDSVKRQDLEQTVLSTGQVTSSVDLNLSFSGSGVVRRVNVKEGDKVKSGQVLATLDQGTVQASLTSAAGSLASARANYDRIVSGSTNEQVKISQAAVNTAQVSVNNAKSTLEQTKASQAQIVENARRATMNTGLAATPDTLTASVSTAPSIVGTYTGLEQGQYKIDLYKGGNGLYYTVSGLEVSSGPVITGTSLPLGARGLYMQFSSAAPYTDLDAWTVDVPNTRAALYLTNQSAYQSALQGQSLAIASAQNAVNSAEAGLNQAEASLAQTLASAPAADISAAKAQILSAQGQLQAAQAAYDNTVIKAPMAGTITSINIKVGELASAMSSVMVLQNINDLHAEANVSEANVSSLAVGQAVDYTFDALGPDRHFTGKIQSINPASTVVSGVVNYKVTASIEGVTEIKPGMTANMTIMVAQKSQVIAVPSRALVNNNGDYEIRVINDIKKKTFTNTPVEIGLRADGGLVEILSGLNIGQTIVTYIQP